MSDKRLLLFNAVSGERPRCSLMPTLQIAGLTFLSPVVSLITESKTKGRLSRGLLFLVIWLIVFEYYIPPDPRLSCPILLCIFVHFYLQSCQNLVASLYSALVVPSNEDGLCQLKLDKENWADSCQRVTLCLVHFWCPGYQLPLTNRLHLCNVVSFCRAVVFISDELIALYFNNTLGPWFPKCTWCVFALGFNLLPWLFVKTTLLFLCGEFFPSHVFQQRSPPMRRIPSNNSNTDLKVILVTGTSVSDFVFPQASTETNGANFFTPKAR